MLWKVVRVAALVAVLLVAALVLRTAMHIQRVGARDEARPADVIMILGAAEYRGKPSPVLKARLDHGLELFLEKRMGIKGGTVKTSKHAYLAIEGLKKMIANGMKKTYGEAWWTKVYSNPDLNEFIRIHKPGEWR